MSNTKPAPASLAQLRFILVLIAERDLSSIVNVKYLGRIEELRKAIPAFLIHPELSNPMTATGAHTLIDGLTPLPKLAGTEEAAALRDAVPAGYYGIDWDGEIRFFRIDKPAEGKWAGYTFVKGLVGPEEHRVSRVTADRVIEAVTADPKAAAVRYGHEIGRCSICNRRLTNAASRAAGIGPQCASKF